MAAQNDSQDDGEPFDDDTSSADLDITAAFRQLHAIFEETARIPESWIDLRDYAKEILDAVGELQIPVPDDLLDAFPPAARQMLVTAYLTSWFELAAPQIQALPTSGAPSVQ